MTNKFAQATNVPTSGASNAQDFHPETRNPQAVGGNVQAAPGPQSTSPQEVLSDQNSRIIVPTTNSGQTVAPPPTPATGGVNWFLVMAIAAVIVVSLEYLFRRRSKRTPNQKAVSSPPQETITFPEEPMDSPTVEVVAKKPPAPKKKPAKKPSAKKKSKSKRKKSRK